MWFFVASCSAVLSAVSAVIQKTVLFRLSALEFSFLVSAATVTVTSFVPLSVDVTAIPLSTVEIIVGKSILGSAAFLFVMKSLEQNQISTALPLLGLTPAVTALASLLLTGESLRAHEWMGIALMMAGAYILDMRPGDGFFRPFAESLTSMHRFYILGALVLFALSSLVDKSLVTSLNTAPLVVLYYQHIVYVLVFGTLLWMRKRSVRAILDLGRGQFHLFAAVAILTVGYRYTQLEATRYAPVALVLATKRTSILYASFFGGRLFSDNRLRLKLFGAALIVISGFVILRAVA